jgi:hypothetical protein
MIQIPAPTRLGYRRGILIAAAVSPLLGLFLYDLPSDSRLLIRTLGNVQAALLTLNSIGVLLCIRRTPVKALVALGVTSLLHVVLLALMPAFMSGGYMTLEEARGLTQQGAGISLQVWLWGAYGAAYNTALKRKETSWILD